jgi:hypothetical protein
VITKVGLVPPEFLVKVIQGDLDVKVMGLQPLAILVVVETVYLLLLLEPQLLVPVEAEEEVTVHRAIFHNDLTA